jgi:riboflavin synthase alpha subunit
VSASTPAHERNVFLRVPGELMKYLSYKGFVALDGASLTISHVDAGAADRRQPDSGNHRPHDAGRRGRR